MGDEYKDSAERLETQASRRGGKSRGGGGRRGRGGGAGGSGGQNRDVQISKALSTLLRHQAAAAGVELDDEGFARLDKVLLWPRLRGLKPTFEDIQREVVTNAKQRFSMKPNPASANNDSTDPSDWLIRANQGHSIELASESLHTPITLESGNIPQIVVHGTYFAFWPQIVASGGLKKMTRTHVHFGTGLPEDGNTHDEGDEAGRQPKVVSGMRSDAEILVFVDVEKSLRAGDMKWWLSENGVVLTEGNEEGVVPTKYYKEVRGRKQGVGELWRDGKKVAGLPEGIVSRVPYGKQGVRNGGRGGKRGARGS